MIIFTEKRLKNMLSCFLQNISQSSFSKWILEEKTTFSTQLFTTGDLTNFPITAWSKVKPSQAEGQRIHLATTANTKRAAFWVSSSDARPSVAQEGQQLGKLYQNMSLIYSCGCKHSGDAPATFCTISYSYPDHF